MLASPNTRNLKLILFGTNICCEAWKQIVLIYDSELLISGSSDLRDSKWLDFWDVQIIGGSVAETSFPWHIVTCP